MTRVYTRPPDGTCTVQKGPAAALDINRIVDMASRLGPSGPRQPIFGDFTSPTSTDYAAALDMALSAERRFLQLPVWIREHYANSIPAWLTAVENGSFKREFEHRMRGFRKPPKAPEPAPTPATATRPDPEAQPRRTPREGD